MCAREFVCVVVCVCVHVCVSVYVCECARSCVHANYSQCAKLTQRDCLFRCAACGTKTTDKERARTTELGKARRLGAGSLLGRIPADACVVICWEGSGDLTGYGLVFKI